ncbi:hypothetical protein D3C76_181370 [compost metagenome]
MNAVYDRASTKICKDDITVTSHKLYDDLFGGDVSKLISSLNIYVNNSFHAYLSDTLNSPTFTVLTHKHAEHRGF